MDKKTNNTQTVASMWTFGEDWIGRFFLLNVICDSLLQINYRNKNINEIEHDLLNLIVIVI